MSVHAQVQTEFKAHNNVTKLRIQQPFYSSAFSFFLGLSHFILIPPVCFFYHLSFVFFFHCFHLHTSVVAFFLLLCLSVSLWPFHCKILSPPWFPVFNGCGLGKKHEWGTARVLYTGENPSQRVRKDYKREQRLRAQSTKYVFKQDLRRDILIAFAQTLRWTTDFTEEKMQRNNRCWILMNLN